MSDGPAEFFAFLTKVIDLAARVPPAGWHRLDSHGLREDDIGWYRVAYRVEENGTGRSIGF
jgi:hypothetical protein